MIARSSIIFALCIVFFGFAGPGSSRVFLIGDSTMAEKPLIDNPERGWGQMLPMFFSRDVAIFNHAKNGRSTKSFLREGRWDSVMAALRAGDYVFIQFGHNDSKVEDTNRYAAPRTTYRTNLIRYISDARSKQAIPVLITPVNRRNFDLTGRFVDKHGEYPVVVRELAASENVPLIDLHKSSRMLFEQLGDEVSKQLFLVSVKPKIYRALPNGKNDNTHFTRYGAATIAELVVNGMKEIQLPLRQYLVTNPAIEAPTGKIAVGLDQYFNCETKILKDSTPLRFHYTWEDTMDSGFSVLGSIFDRTGIDIDTINSAPTKESLDRVSIYIIVDPDTPKESAVPKYISSSDITVIQNWVKRGGILILMGNDKGNSEFQHFNELAGIFGIRFNEDMHQDVKNNQYDSGKVTAFPSHPMFNGVRYAFIKQLSSLSLSSPAREILHSRGATVMAEARYGKGFVFAVGDPWLYNEYIDNRRLPSGVENYDAAVGLVRWLYTSAKKVR